MITDKRFVKTWMTSDTLGEVAKKLNTTRGSVSAKATTLRGRGVNLPRKSPSANAYTSTDELNQLIASYNEK